MKVSVKFQKSLFCDYFSFIIAGFIFNVSFRTDIGFLELHDVKNIPDFPWDYLQINSFEKLDKNGNSHLINGFQFAKITKNDKYQIWDYENFIKQFLQENVNIAYQMFIDYLENDCFKYIELK